MTRENFNWQEIDLDFFISEVFERYWQRDPGTLEKIIEVQCLQEERNRLFFGAGINVLDYKEWNKDTVDLIEKCEMILKFMPIPGSKFKNINDCQISVCTISEGYGPLISPLGAVPDHHDLVRHVYFGGEISKDLQDSVQLFMKGSSKDDVIIPCWFYKEGGYYKTGDTLKKDKDNKIRIRIWNFLEWKEMVKDYIKSSLNFPDYVNKDDVSRDLIVLCP